MDDMFGGFKGGIPLGKLWEILNSGENFANRLRNDKIWFG
jgi:hypothetical protein